MKVNTIKAIAITIAGSLMIQINSVKSMQEKKNCNSKISLEQKQHQSQTQYSAYKAPNNNFSCHNNLMLPKYYDDTYLRSKHQKLIGNHLNSNQQVINL